MSAGCCTDQLRTVEGESQVCTLRLGISREAIAPGGIQRIALHNVALGLQARRQSRQHATHGNIAAAPLPCAW